MQRRTKTNKLNDEVTKTVNGGGGIFDPAIHSIVDAIDWSVFDPAVNKVKSAAERAYDKAEPVVDKVFEHVVSPTIEAVDTLGVRDAVKQTLTSVEKQITDVLNSAR